MKGDMIMKGKVKIVFVDENKEKTLRGVIESENLGRLILWAIFILVALGVAYVFLRRLL